MNAAATQFVLESVTAQYEGVKAQLDDAKARLEVVEAERDNVKAELQAKTAEREQSHQQNQLLQQRITELEELVAGFGGIRAELQDTITRLEQQVEQLQAQRANTLAASKRNYAEEMDV
jgi:uncharacterized protein (DUF3084 family)